MHMLLIEGKFNPGKKEEFIILWTDQILPTLKKQTGYVDEILLFGDETLEGVGLSFWKTKKDAERYQREIFSQQADKVKHLLAGPPKIRNFNVEAAETFRISALKAA